MEAKKSTEKRSATKVSLLAHYSNEVCSHVEGVIALFFSLVGTLFIMTLIQSFLGRIVFSVMYFVLGFLAVYFYVRLFYYRKMLERILLKPPYRESHLEFENHVFKESKLIEWVHARSRRERGYNLEWAWLMLVVAVIVALLSWIIVFFCL